jgi:hypothetical protein
VGVNLPVVFLLALLIEGLVGETQTSPEPARAGITTCTLPLTLPLFFLYILALGSGVLDVVKPSKRLLISPPHRGARGRDTNLSPAGKNKHKNTCTQHPHCYSSFSLYLPWDQDSGVLGGSKPPSRLLISPTHRGASGRDTLPWDQDSGVLGGSKPPSRLLISPTHRGASGRDTILSRASKNKHKYLHPTPTLPLFFLSVLPFGSGVLGGGKPPRRLLISPIHWGASGRGTSLSRAGKNNHKYLHPTPHIATLLSLCTCLRVRGIERG